MVIRTQLEADGPIRIDTVTHANRHLRILDLLPGQRCVLCQAQFCGLVAGRGVIERYLKVACSVKSGARGAAVVPAYPRGVRTGGDRVRAFEVTSDAGVDQVDAGVKALIVYPRICRHVL